MKKLIFSEPLDYLALLIRRKWWIMIPFALLSSAIAVVTYHLPDVYVSETFIQVEPRDVPNDFVRDLITTNTTQRLSSVQQTLLSQTNLFRVITEFESELTSLQGLADNQKVNTFRSRIGFQVESLAGGTSFLSIRYEDQNPELAQRITSRLASLVIEYDNRLRQEQVFGTGEFLDSEIEKVSRELAKAEELLAQMKGAYRYELPDQLQTNLRTLDQLHLQLQTNTETLDRSRQLRLELEQQIAERDPEIVQEIDPVASGLSPLVIEYREKERLYTKLLTKYTKIHPDIQRLRVELDQLKSEIPPEDLVESEELADLEGEKIIRPNPVYQNLTAQLSEIVREIELRERKRGQLEAAVKQYTLRVQNTPQREQEMASIVRSHGELSAQYQSLQGKLVQTRLAESLESKQKGAHFVILDPANYPTKPSKPNRPGIILIGLFLSFGFGVGLAFSVDLFDQKLWTTTEVEKLLGVPVLIEIPEIVTEADLQSRKRQRLKYLVLSFVTTGIFFAAIFSVYTNPELKALTGRYFQHITDLAASSLNLQ